MLDLATDFASAVPPLIFLCEPLLLVYLNKLSERIRRQPLGRTNYFRCGVRGAGFLLARQLSIMLFYIKLTTVYGNLLFHSRPYTQKLKRLIYLGFSVMIFIVLRSKKKGELS